MPERVRFTLDGRPAEAEGGTSLLAALWNAGRRAVRTSVSGEARGPLCGMGACFECRVTIDGEPHRRACLETVREGMRVGLHEPVIPSPDPRGTRVALSNDLSCEALPRDAKGSSSAPREGLGEGLFISRSFVSPRDEESAGPPADSLSQDSSLVSRGSSPGPTDAPRGDKVVARAAGEAPVHTRCDRSRLSAEVVVVGGGPAGIAAAVHAAEAGARTLLLDEQARPGGQIWRGEAPPAAREWLLRLARSGTAVLAGATVVDVPEPNELLVERDGLPVRVAFERLVLATGARELFLPFPGWTLPGVVGVGW